MKGSRYLVSWIYTEFLILYLLCTTGLPSVLKLLISCSNKSVDISSEKTFD